jgi:hypothetical protein
MKRDFCLSRGCLESYQFGGAGVGAMRSGSVSCPTAPTMPLTFMLGMYKV